MGFGDPGQGQHGWTPDEAHAREIIRRGLELGWKHFIIYMLFTIAFAWGTGMIVNLLV